MQARVDARRQGRKEIFSLLPLRATLRVAGHDFHAHGGKIFSYFELCSREGVTEKSFYKEAPPWAELFKAGLR